MKLEISAPTELAQAVAELALGGGLVVWTRATGEGGADLGARTVVHFDGDVTTTITRACLSHPGGCELVRRHDREMQKVGEMLRSGAARAARRIAWTSAILMVLATVAGIASGHSWPHVIAALGGIGAVGALAAWLVRRYGPRLLVRSAKCAIAERRRAQHASS